MMILAKVWPSQEQRLSNQFQVVPTRLPEIQPVEDNQSGTFQEAFMDSGRSAKWIKILF
jgi:hypothetical protein